MAAPLDGVRVIDAASWLAAPAAAGLMADMGADVIKVEPPAGDSYRSVSSLSHLPIHAGWENDNRGKRGVALDLDRPAGREILWRLCRDVDVLIHNSTPRRAARYGLAFEDVRAHNPRIVHTVLSGYGSRGPEADRLGFDFLTFWARSGIQGLIGEVDAPPVTMLGGQGDHTTTLNILAAVLAALRLRDRTGEAQQVEVSLQQSGLWTISNQVQAALLGTPPAAKTDRMAPVNPISNSYPTRDGRWIRLQMPQLERFWPKVCALLDHPEWVEEFPDFKAVTSHGAVIRERLDAAFLERDFDDWCRRLAETDLLWAAIATIEEVIADPQLRAMGAFEEVEHPRYGPIEMVAAPFHIAGADVHVRRSAPAVGEHTAEVLLEAGLTSDEVASYAEQGAFG